MKKIVCALVVLTLALPASATTCLSDTAPEFADWQAWGEMNCWCYQYQCRGDIDGTKVGFWRVQALDLATFRAAFFQMDGPLAAVPNGICADLDHSRIGYWHVGAPDLALFRMYFLQLDAAVPSCDADPVYTGPYNFWTSP